ncbi:hypothetical protein [Absidia glauca]|uniref:Uncharacterized protein n=1 Tax=Absidia glauca TaxID=4829 RepID=A0A163JJM5_ABSGL|nr:hypothetical protein [Absidia glauca]
MTTNPTTPQIFDRTTIDGALESSDIIGVKKLINDTISVKLTCWKACFDYINEACAYKWISSKIVKNFDGEIDVYE